MKTERFKNPWFWVGVVSVALTAIGVDPQTFTYYAGRTPASLPALWSIRHTTNPAKAKAYMAPNGHPDGWTDLGTVEDVQGAV